MVRRPRSRRLEACSRCAKMSRRRGSGRDCIGRREGRSACGRAPVSEPGRRLISQGLGDLRLTDAAIKARWYRAASQPGAACRDKILPLSAPRGAFMKPASFSLWLAAILCGVAGGCVAQAPTATQGPTTSPEGPPPIRRSPQPSLVESGERCWLERGRRPAWPFCGSMVTTRDKLGSPDCPPVGYGRSVRVWAERVPLA